MMKKIILVILIITFHSCSNDQHKPIPIHCQLAKKIMTQFVKNMEKKHMLACSGSGGGFLGQVKKITLSFTTIGPRSEMELRVLMVDIAEDFLNRINSDEEIRPYLLNYPFNSSNLEFMITLRGKDLNPIKNKGDKKDLLYGVLLMKGKLFYEISNEDKPHLQDVHEETYEEAFEIVEKQKISITSIPSGN